MISRRVVRLAAVIWTLVIIVLLSIPGQDIPDVEIVQIDKFVHFAVFATWAWLWAAVVQNGRRIGLVLFGGISFAILSELYQGLLPFERSPDPYDVLANCLGVFVSVLIFRFYSKSGRTEHSPSRSG